MADHWRYVRTSGTTGEVGFKPSNNQLHLPRQAWRRRFVLADARTAQVNWCCADVAT
jgi:hypothetical protein